MNRLEYLEMEAFKGKNVSVMPIKDVVIKDISKGFESSDYYDKNCWAKEIESLNKKDDSYISRLNLEPEVSEFFDNHRKEIEETVNYVTKDLGISTRDICGSDKISKKQIFSVIAYKKVLSDLYKEIVEDNFKIPQINDKRRQDSYIYRKDICNYGFEMQ